MSSSSTATAHRLRLGLGVVVPWSVPSSVLKSSLFLVKCDDHSTRKTPTGEQEGLAVFEPTGGKRKVRKDVVNSVGKNRG